jgi:hypothetical protein
VRASINVRVQQRAGRVVEPGDRLQPLAARLRVQRGRAVVAGELHLDVAAHRIDALEGRRHYPRRHAVSPSACHDLSTGRDGTRR